MPVFGGIITNFSSTIKPLNRDSPFRDISHQPTSFCIFPDDRVFQTPSFENILLSSSTQVESLDPGTFLRLPVEPSVGDYFEGGLTQEFFGKAKLDINYFRRVANNYADDDQIDNTTISFPIAFQKAIIYGAEGKLDLPQWGRFSGFLSYSYEVGNAWNPVTGGLFLGNDATAAETELLRPLSCLPGSTQYSQRATSLSDSSSILAGGRDPI